MMVFEFLKSGDCLNYQLFEYPTNILYTEGTQWMASSLLTKCDTSILSAWAKSKGNSLISHTDWSTHPSAQILRLEFFNVQITIRGYQYGLMHDQKFFPPWARKPLVCSQRQLCAESGTVCDSKFHAFLFYVLYAFLQEPPHFQGISIRPAVGCWPLELFGKAQILCIIWSGIRVCIFSAHLNYNWLISVNHM